MRHRFAGKHLGRTPSHRLAMRRNLAGSIIEHGAVVTTMAKAKDIRRFVEKLITIAKQDTLASRRRIKSMLGEREIVPVEDGIPLPALKKSERVTVLTKLISEIAPRFADRNGGYTRIIRLGETRIGDAGEKVMIQLLGEEDEAGEAGAKPRSQRRKRAAKRYQAAKAATGGAATAQAEKKQKPEQKEPAAEAPAEEEADDQQQEDQQQDEEKSE
ncbi:MAG: 50S ribosomal protein L17 [Planctomycetota bacterium]